MLSKALTKVFIVVFTMELIFSMAVPRMELAVLSEQPLVYKIQLAFNTDEVGSQSTKDGGQLHGAIALANCELDRNFSAIKGIELIEVVGITKHFGADSRSYRLITVAK